MHAGISVGQIGGDACRIDRRVQEVSSARREPSFS